MTKHTWHTPHLIALTNGSQAENATHGQYTDGATQGSTLAS